MDILGSKPGSVPHKLCVTGRYGLNYVPPNSCIEALTLSGTLMMRLVPLQEGEETQALSLSAHEVTARRQSSASQKESPHQNLATPAP